MDFDEIFEEYFDRIYYKVLGVVKNPEDDMRHISRKFLWVFIEIWRVFVQRVIYILGYTRLLSIKFMISLEKER